MNKCLICGKRIWFWQKKLKTEDKVIHLKCDENGLNLEKCEDKLLTEEDIPIEELPEEVLECEKEKVVEKELCLSDKIISVEDPAPQSKVLFVSDVQDSIKKLKEVLFDDPEPCCMGVRRDEAFRKIDKIFGEGLI